MGAGAPCQGDDGGIGLWDEVKVIVSGDVVRVIVRALVAGEAGSASPAKGAHGHPGGHGRDGAGPQERGGASAHCTLRHCTALHCTLGDCNSAQLQV